MYTPRLLPVVLLSSLFLLIFMVPEAVAITLMFAVFIERFLCWKLEIIPPPPGCPPLELEALRPDYGLGLRELAKLIV